MTRVLQALTTAALPLLLLAACDEGFNEAPETVDGVVVRITGHSDTLVVGGTRTVRATAVDQFGNEIVGVPIRLSSSDDSRLNISPAEAQSGTDRTVEGRFPGTGTITVAVRDPRFRADTVRLGFTTVTAGVRIQTARDTTVDAVSDAFNMIARGLVRGAGTTTVPAAGLGVVWRRFGDGAVSIAGTGDTVRVTSIKLGTDTLVASHPLCLAGVRCADTAVVRVRQSLALVLSGRTFNAWSIGDTVGPTVSVRDARGLGQAGTSVRFIPFGVTDLVFVTITAPTGTANLANGRVPAPRLVARGNGTARILVQGLDSLGTVIGTDTVTVAVRQIAARIQALPLAGQLTQGLSIPVRGTAYDARGNTVADATVPLRGVGIAVANGTATMGELTVPTPTLLIPSILGAANPAEQPNAPPLLLAVDTAVVEGSPVPPPFTAVPSDTVTPAPALDVTALYLGPTGTGVSNTWIRFLRSGGTALDSVRTNSEGVAQIRWTLPRQAGTYEISAVVTTPRILTPADSAGRILTRRAVVVRNPVQNP